MFFFTKYSGPSLNGHTLERTASLERMQQSNHHECMCSFTKVANQIRAQLFCRMGVASRGGQLCVHCMAHVMKYLSLSRTRATTRDT